MSSVQNSVLKEELVEWIETIEDEQLLYFLNALRQKGQTTQTDWWDGLSEDEKENIRLGLQDLKDGRVMDSSAFWQKLGN